MRAVQKAGYTRVPLEDGTLDGVHGQADPDELADHARRRGPRRRDLARRAEGQEPVRARRALLALRPPDRRHREVDPRQVQRPGDGGQPGRVPGGLELRRDVGDDRRAGQGRPQRRDRARAPTATSTAPRRPRSGWSRRRSSRGLPLVFGAYPITPASDLLHALSRRQDLGVRTIQAEDEIAAASMALGAAFGGALGVTCTSGPGLDLKTETIGLAVMLELPMLIIDVQRAGPSTGMPTKTEQSDLLQALYGRHGESPLPVLASSSPGQCFEMVYEAVRIAVTYRTPVILLSDLFVANSSEPWQIPSAAVAAADRPALPHVAARRGPVPPVRARRPPGAAVGDPRDARAGAPDRRAGEGRRDRRDLLRRPQPRAHDRAAGGEGGGDRGAGRRGARRGRRRPAGARLGLVATGRSAPAPGGCASAAGGSPRRTCITSTRCRRTWARCCAPSSACSSPR